MDFERAFEIEAGQICRYCFEEMKPAPKNPDIVTCETCKKILAGAICQYCLTILTKISPKEPQVCVTCAGDGQIET